MVSACRSSSVSTSVPSLQGEGGRRMSHARMHAHTLMQPVVCGNGVLHVEQMYRVRNNTAIVPCHPLVLWCAHMLLQLHSPESDSGRCLCDGPCPLHHVLQHIRRRLCNVETHTAAYTEGHSNQCSMDPGRCMGDIVNSSSQSAGPSQNTSATTASLYAASLGGHQLTNEYY